MAVMKLDFMFRVHIWSPFP